MRTRPGSQLCMAAPDIAAGVVDFAHTEPGGTRGRDFGLGLVAGLALGGGFAMSLAVAQVRRPEATSEPSSTGAAET